MIDFNGWLMQLPNHYFVTLFNSNDGLLVNVKTKNDRTLLMRSADMENAVINTIENNISNDDWQGLIYVMGKGQGISFKPIYIGKAEKKGVTNPISENIKNIRKNQHKFARWGDGIAYHIGDLSHAMYGFQAYKKPNKKYKTWAKALFETNDPPKLKEPIFFFIAPWFTGDKGLSGLPCSLPAAEKEMIAIASVQYADTLLNLDGI
jgi:hypothetical protein